jgi:hypothetical protein
VLAVRALRMLVDTGAVKGSDIPVDIDGRRPVAEPVDGGRPVAEPVDGGRPVAEPVDAK